jgi:hypothetical protein
MNPENKATSKGQQCVNASYFIDNAPVLKGCQRKVGQRVLYAAGKYQLFYNQSIGIDVEDPKASVMWEDFLNINCTLDKGSVEIGYQIKFWQRFFDTTKSGITPESDYMSMLECLIRGQSLPSPNSSSLLFAELYQKKLRESNCLDPTDSSLLLDKFKRAIEQGLIQTDILCVSINNA